MYYSPFLLCYWIWFSWFFSHFRHTNSWKTFISSFRKCLPNACYVQDIDSSCAVTFRSFRLELRCILAWKWSKNKRNVSQKLSIKAKLRNMICLFFSSLQGWIWSLTWTLNRSHPVRFHLLSLDSPHLSLFTFNHLLFLLPCYNSQIVLNY